MNGKPGVLAVMEQDAQAARLWREARISSTFVLAANAEQSREARATVERAEKLLVAIRAAGDRGLSLHTQREVRELLAAFRGEQ